METINALLPTSVEAGCRMNNTPAVRSQKYMIPATIHSGDGALIVHFDALPWAEIATITELQRFFESDGDDTRDAVYTCSLVNPKVREVLDYTRKARLEPQTPEKHYFVRCYLSTASVLAWIQDNRPAVCPRPLLPIEPQS